MNLNVSKIVIDFLLERPFFGVILAKLQVLEEVSAITAYTDGRTIRINPIWTNELNQSEQMGLMAHEVLHVALLHHLRRQGRDPRKWNIACDMAINPILKEAGFSIPKGGLFDTQKPPRSAEAIYPDVTDDMVKNCVSWGEVVDFKGGDIAVEQERVTILVSDAYRRSSAGSLPAGLERQIIALVAPPIPWKNILENYVMTTLRERYSAVKFNRRFIRDNVYLPALHSTRLSLVVAVDTSGSISNEQLAEIAGIINDMRLQVPSMTITVLYCDAKVQRREIFESDDALVFHPKGGGGTDFRPIFEAIKQDLQQPDALIYLTDGYGTYPDRNEIDFPVVWVLLRNKKEIEIECW